MAQKNIAVNIIGTDEIIKLLDYMKVLADQVDSVVGDESLSLEARDVLASKTNPTIEGMNAFMKDKFIEQGEVPLLTIELQDETSVPKVIYKGEEIDGKKRVSFDWETDTDIMGGLTYAIEHCESGSYPVINGIERKIKGHSVY